MMPLYGFLQGDTVGLLILAREDERVAELTHRLQDSARVRVKPKAGMKLLYNGRLLEPHHTLGQVGMEPLDRIDVVDGGT